ncbi:MAG TPA: hypothetical protein VFJ54_01485 [Actinomycetota bacterium]|nr:hypothetical protein [Actinomycetota bacterium]
MGVPPVEPIAGAESSIWPAIITAIVFGTLLVATIWTYLWNRPAAALPDEEEHQLLKAA